MTKIPTIDKREEIVQAMTVGIGLLAQTLVTVSEATRRAAEALEAVAKSMEEQAEKSEDESAGSNGSSGPTGPYGTVRPDDFYGSSRPSGPYDSTGPTGADVPGQRAPQDGPWDEPPMNP